MDGLDHVRRFIELYVIAEAIRSSETDWDTKYDVIFPKILKLVKETEIDFEWYDPDTSYEEDVNAFVNALQNKANELWKIIQAVDAAVNFKQ